jgi:peroxiredoxin
MLSRRRFWTSLLATAIVLLSWFNWTAPAWALGGKLPALNAPAPSFTLPTNTGNGQVSLKDYQGQWVVLYFYPKDFTSGCTLEARRFQQDIAKYEQHHTQIIGISADSVDSHAKFCDSEGLKFPLLADSDAPHLHYFAHRRTPSYFHWCESRSSQPRSSDQIGATAKDLAGNFDADRRNRSICGRINRSYPYIPAKNP